MIIKEITWRNFGSYGFKTQKLLFNDEGSLTNLNGKNGSGKSTIRNVIDLCLFQKVSARTKKSLSLKELPNRQNQSRNLFAGLKYTNINNQEIDIEIGISPNKFKINVDNQDFTERYRQLDEKGKEKLIGFSYSMFKSFISLCMKDFENFIELTENSKNVLIDKLFQLDDMKNYYSIAKGLYEQYQKAYQIHNDRLYSLQSEMNNLKKILDVVKTSPTERLNELKKESNSYKPRFNELDNEITSETNKIQEITEFLNSAIQQKNEQYKKIEMLKIRIENLDEKYKCYLNGICPYCDTDLKDDSHLHKKEDIENEINNKKNELKESEDIYNNMVIEEARIRKNKETSYQLLSNKKNEKSEIFSKLKQLKNEYDILSKQDNVIDFDKIKEEYNSLKLEYDEVVKKKNESSRLIDNYKKLCEILSGIEIRKSMISKIIKPVNVYLKSYIERLVPNFKVVLDENFNAKIDQIYDNINSQTLSKGEAMMINLSIALSYLCSIMDLKHCNILFLDEVFDGIDVENVDIILTLLKEIAMKYKINIIIVHHNTLDMNKLDRIIKVKKTGFFSDIEEIIVKK